MKEILRPFKVIIWFIFNSFYLSLKHKDIGFIKDIFTWTYDGMNAEYTFKDY